MVKTADVFRVISFYPLLYVIYFFVIIFIDHHGHLDKNFVLPVFLIGLVISLTLILPVWFFLALLCVIKEERKKKLILPALVFFLSSFTLIYFLYINDAFCFWGCIVD